MFILGYLDELDERSVIRFYNLILSLLCGYFTGDEKYYRMYFIGLAMFHICDIVDYQLEIKPFTRKISFTRLVFVVVLYNYNLICLFISTNFFTQLYHFLFLMDVFLTLRYMYEKSKTKHVRFEETQKA